MRMKDKVAFVTGGASGLGAQTARVWAREGAKICIADMNMDAAHAVVQDIKDAGGDAMAVSVNVTSSDSIKAAIDATVAQFGKLDTVFAGAGITINGTAVDMDEDDWDRVIDINLKGVFLTCKHTIPALEKAGGGSVVLVGSIVSFTGKSMSVAYATSKSALRTFSKNTALKFAAKGVRVNMVCPGHCETPLVKELFAKTPGWRDALLQRYPMGRFGSETDVANAALFLACNESAWVTGTELVVDGGFLAG